MRYSRRSVTLFLALVTTLLGEFFLLVWRVQERQALLVTAIILFAVAFVVWVVAVRELRAARRR